MSDDLFEDHDLEKLEQEWNVLADRVVKGSEYVAEHPEDAPKLKQLLAKQDELRTKIRAIASWRTVSVRFNYPEDDEFGDRPGFAVIDRQGVVTKDENGARVIDTIYTRGELRAMLKIVGAID